VGEKMDPDSNWSLLMAGGWIAEFWAAILA